MNVIIIHLPEHYRHDHFTLTIEDKGDDSEVVRQTKILSDAGDTLKDAVDKNSPKKQN